MANTINWIQAGEYVVGDNSATGLIDVANRPLKQLLSISGDDVSGIAVVGYAKIGHTHNIADITGSINADTLQGHAASDFRLATTGITWTDISSTPTTLAGYGIADAYTKTEVDGQIATINTSLNAKADKVSGLVPTAQLGSGTPDNTKFLRGDQTWAVPAGGGGSSTLPYPDNPPASPSTFDDEFNVGSALNAKWAVSQAPTGSHVYTVNTIPSWVVLSCAATSNNSRTLTAYQAASITSATAFSFTAKVSTSAVADSAGASVVAADSAKTNQIIIWLRHATTLSVQAVKDVGGVLTTVGTLGWNTNTAYIHVQRNGANTWSGYASYDGITWFIIFTGVALTFNVSFFGITLTGDEGNSDAVMAAIGWFRVNWLTL